MVLDVSREKLAGELQVYELEYAYNEDDQNTKKAKTTKKTKIFLKGI